MQSQTKTKKKNKQEEQKKRREISAEGGSERGSKIHNCQFIIHQWLKTVRDHIPVLNTAHQDRPRSRWKERLGGNEETRLYRISLYHL